MEPVRRKLFSRQPMTPLVVSPPDTSGTAVVHMVEREDGPRETECPEDLVLAGDKKTKKVTFMQNLEHVCTHVQCVYMHVHTYNKLHVYMYVSFSQTDF